MNKDKRKYPPVSEISREQHQDIVTEIFSSVTGRYDFLNRMLSMRLDVAWRKALIGKMRFFRTNRLLDVATGTADVAIGAARAYPFIEVTGIDPSGPMLAIGREKVIRAGLAGRIILADGDALQLPFADSSFDVAAAAFGMRNISDKLVALREMTRVVVPGGRVMVLEMGMPRPGFLRGMYRFHLTHIMPRVARMFTANAAAYEYLADTIINFPSPEVFGSMMESAGLTGIEITDLTFGVTRLFEGCKQGGLFRP